MSAAEVEARLGRVEVRTAADALIADAVERLSRMGLTPGEAAVALSVRAQEAARSLYAPMVGPLKASELTRRAADAVVARAMGQDKAVAYAAERALAIMASPLVR